ncbi:hypothetical protein ANCDUO_16808 [Ancylostoma duodenale]|uniref:Uncharacterized protein n=1 Tax=Ancylostoma duodenale TaxID=51022 RepID=A0A0C2FWX6_9BILA|nr:hypothetical protein ANCDUO_16808 [Ancylostoma duodenale]
MSKRMFTIVCQQTGMTSLAHIQYTGTCPRLFNDLADEYVAVKRRINKKFHAAYTYSMCWSGPGRN